MSVVAIVSLIGIIGWHRYYYPKPERLPGERFQTPLVLIGAAAMPAFHDDLGGSELLHAIELHLKSLRTASLDQEVVFGQMKIPRRRVVKTLEKVKTLLKTKGIEGLQQEISRHFFVYQAAGQTRKGDVLFTGYYQPILEARLKPDKEFRYPLYKKPLDLQVLDLASIGPDYAGMKIALRVDKGTIKPYFDREAIDTCASLTGKGLELAYLKDYLDRYLLHIQGSGLLKIEDGRMVKVGYAGCNYFPYLSLGKLLINEGVIPAEAMSIQAIRQFYQRSPAEAVRYINRNRRYIFFDEITDEIKGAAGVELTPGRSIATDKSIFPGGGLAFIVCRKPSAGTYGQAAEKISLARFMVDQDAGSAIKGPGRVDVFWGTGEEAGKTAGNFMEKGELYYFLAKEE